jgi:hypothetical protein
MEFLIYGYECLTDNVQSGYGGEKTEIYIFHGFPSLVLRDSDYIAQVRRPT